MPDYDMGTAKGRVVLDSSGVKAGVDGATRSLTELDAKAAKSAQGLHTLELGMVALGAVAVAGFTHAVKAAADFEQTMSGIKAVSGATATQMDALRKKALKLGADTAFSATEAADAMEELSRRGLTVDQVLNGAADATIALAAATGVDLVTAATVSSNAMNAFGLSAQQLPKVADMIAGFDVVGSNVDDFGAALTQAGASAHLAGLSFEDTTLAIAAMSKAGINGSDAGTSLKTFLANLQPTTKESAALFKELGLTLDANKTSMNKTGDAFFDAQGKLKPMAQISDILAKSLKGMSAQQQAATLQMLFGSDAIRAAAVIAGTGKAGFEGLAKAMGEVSAADQAKIRMDNLKGSIEQLTGSLDTVSINIGTTYLPALQKLADQGTVYVNKFGEMDASTQKWIVSAGLGTAAAAGLLGTLGLFAHTAAPAIAGIGQIAGVVSNLGTVLIGVITSPITLTIAAIAALVLGVIYAYNHFEGFRNVVDTVGRAIKAFALTVYDWIINTAIPALKAFGEYFMAVIWPKIQAFVAAAIEAVKAFANFFMENILPAIKAFWAAVQPVLQKIWEYFINEILPRIKEFVDGAVAVLKKVVAFFVDNILPVIVEFGKTAIRIFGEVVDFFKGIVSAIAGFIDKIVSNFQIMSAEIGDVWKQIKNFIEPFWKWFDANVVSTAKAFIDLLVAIFNRLAQFFSNVLVPLWQASWTIISTVVKAAWDIIVPIVQTAFDIIKAVITTAMDILVPLFQGAWEIIKTVFTTALGIIQNVVTTAFDIIKAIVGVFVDAVMVVWNLFGDNIISAVQIAFDIIKSIVETVFGIIRGIFQVFTGIINLDFGKFMEGLSTLWNTAWNAIKDAVQIVVDVIKLIIETFMDAIHAVFSIGWDAIKAVFSIAWDAIQLIFDTAIGVLKAAWSAVWTALKATAESLWVEIKAVIKVGIDAVKAVLDVVWGTISAAAEAVWEGLKTAASIAWSILQGIIVDPIREVINILTGIWDTVTTITKAAWEGVKSAISGIVDGIKGIVEGGFNGLVSIVSSILNNIISVANKAIDGLNLVNPLDDIPHIPSIGSSKSGDYTPPEVSRGKAFARGGIVTRMVLGMVGEAGPEAIIPMDDVSRAMQLMTQSGLGAMFMANFNAQMPSYLAASPGSSAVAVATPSAPGSSGARDVVHIEQANFYDATDIGTLMQQADMAMQGL